MKLAVAGLLIAGLAVPVLSVTGAAGAVLISLVYLVRLLPPSRRDPAEWLGFTLLP